MAAQKASLDLDFVRSFFPALNGDFIFMDNAGGSQTLKLVVDRISEYLLTSDVQLGASYHISQLASQRLETATKAMALYVNAADHQEVVMGPSSTQLIRILAICIGQGFQEGDEIIVSAAEHEANASPWVELEKKGLKVIRWQVDQETQNLELDTLATLMTDRTRLVTFTHCSNVIGSIQPAKKIIDFIHQKGALTCIDGVAYAPHRLIDVQDLDVDFYIFSFYKVFGPHHAIMYGKKHLLEEMPGFNHYFIDKKAVPYKFQPGNVNYELSYGMLGLPDYLEQVAHHHDTDAKNWALRKKMEYAFELFAAHEAALSKRLLDYLSQKERVHIVGPVSHETEVRVATISFTVTGRKSDAIAKAVDPFNIGLRFGDFYAKKLAEDFGLKSTNGVVRVSMVHYNTFEEIDKVIATLEQVL